MVPNPRIICNTLTKFKMKITVWLQRCAHFCDFGDRFSEFWLSRFSAVFTFYKSEHLVSVPCPLCRPWAPKWSSRLSAVLIKFMHHLIKNDSSHGLIAGVANAPCRFRFFCLGSAPFCPHRIFYNTEWPPHRGHVRETVFFTI